MKKIAALLLSTSLLLTALPTSALAQQTKPNKMTRGEVVEFLLNAADFYNPGIKREDILKGYGKGEAREDQEVSRIEALIMLGRAFSDLPAPKGHDLRVANTSASFTDVPKWAQDEIGKLIASGVITGYPDGKLGVSDHLTKEQLITLTKRFMALEGTNPRDDYYEYVNKKWLNDSKIPAGEKSNGAFKELAKANEDRIKAIIDELVKKQNPAGSKEQKIADFYKSVFDIENRNKQGIKPIAPYLDALDKASSVKELFAASMKMENEISKGALLSFAVLGDAKDSNVNTLYFFGLNTSLDKNSYVSNDEKTKKVYTNYLAKLFVLSGTDEKTAKAQAEDVYAFEKELAASTMDPQIQGNVEISYNPYTKEKFVQLFKTIDMGKYMKEFQVDKADKVIVTDVGLLNKTAEVLNEKNLDKLKAYAKATLLMNAGGSLSEDFLKLANEFEAQRFGIEGEKTNEEMAVMTTQAVMSQYLSQEFAEKYFTKEAKKDVEQMVKQFIEVYKERIQTLDWLSEATKAKAIKKLDKMTIKIGYPDQWKDSLKDVSIKTFADGGSLFDNMVAINKEAKKQRIASLGKPVDKSSWMMSVYEVNAYYIPLNNEIVFPAGILQAPFYDIKAKHETNLGAIGMVIAHEISHAFDNLGSEFDENGNAVNWWTPEDFKKFQEKCDQVISYYDHVEVIPGVYNNGKLTVGENIADLGGMAVSLQVLSKMENPDFKAYFEGYATIWRMTMSKESAAYRSTIDPHSANKVRVNRTVSNFPEFYKAYEVTEKDAMYVAPKDRVSIW
ncbi:M13-type metalloendopeptidase [Paenibacillus azoreducens]|uniref:Endopeptidase n=1 Tax=Paenibacillus azoreducens TaxID=116718 RepID=A0A920CS37_9BACL|nr:M13-type metalloendopeptidase [Paenibacillus azoreducens]GIO46947.1 endopeptidase [Paenibacillus azoreducens]